MKKLLIALLLASSLLSAKKDIEFVIAVPSYNNEKWARRNLESLINQNTDYPYSIVIVNDCSTDRTGEILDEVKKEYNLDDSFLKIIHNPVRIGALANIYNMVHDHCKDHQIVVHVDGDDALAHNNVLKRLEEKYKNPDIWMTYGQFTFYPSGPGGRMWGTTYEIPRESLVNKEVRDCVYVAQHLRTYKAALFKKIKIEHLMLNGEFYEMNADMATMIPMLEMAAPKDMNSKCHSVFIDEIMYIYNWDNPISDHRIIDQEKLDQQGITLEATPYSSPMQQHLEQIIRAIEPYESLDSLD